jgi:hypothetical protein
VTQATVVPPPSSTSLRARATSTSQITLDWGDVAGEDGYTLDRCQGATCTNFVTIATLGADTITFADNSLAGGTTYSYRIRGFNNAGPAPWSNTAVATTQTPLTAPSAPTGVTASATTTRVTLTWTDTSNNETGFRVLRCAGTKCTPTNVVATLAAGTTTWADTSVKRRTTYRYRIQAYNSAGNGNSVIVTVKVG